MANDLLFGPWDNPVAIHFPKKGIMVIEISMSTNRDLAPAVSAQVKPAADDIQLNSGPVGEPIPDPLITKYLKDHKTWTHGAAFSAHSSEGGAGYRNVYFVNLGYVKGQLPKEQAEWKFTMHTPGNTAGTISTGCLTAVEYFYHWDEKNNTTGVVQQNFVLFGNLPGNGFANLVYEFTNGGDTEADVLGNPQIQADAAAILADVSQSAIDHATSVNATVINASFTLVVQFIITEHFPHNDVLFMDIRVTTYKSRLDFPVADGSAGWDTDEADGTGRVELFGDSRAPAPLLPKTLSWRIRLSDLHVGVTVAG